MQRAGSLVSVRFAADRGRNYADMQAAQTWRFPPFFHALLDAGRLPPAERVRGVLHLRRARRRGVRRHRRRAARTRPRAAAAATDRGGGMSAHAGPPRPPRRGPQPRGHPLRPPARLRALRDRAGAGRAGGRAPRRRRRHRRCSSSPHAAGAGDRGADRGDARPRDRHRRAAHRGGQRLRGHAGGGRRRGAAQPASTGRCCATRSGRRGASPTSRSPTGCSAPRTAPGRPRRATRRCACRTSCRSGRCAATSAGERLWHDPAQRQCALGSVTTLIFDDESLVDIGYAEPSGSPGRDAAPAHEARCSRRWRSLVAVLALLAGLLGASTRDDGGFTFVAPGGQTRDHLRPPAERRPLAAVAGRLPAPARAAALQPAVRRAGSSSLNIWGSWCGPCRGEAAALEQVAEASAPARRAAAGHRRARRPRRGRRLRPRPRRQLPVDLRPARALAARAAAATRATPCPRRSCWTGSTGWPRCSSPRCCAEDLQPVVDRIAAEPAPAAG